MSSQQKLDGRSLGVLVFPGNELNDVLGMKDRIARQLRSVKPGRYTVLQR